MSQDRFPPASPSAASPSPGDRAPKAGPPGASLPDALLRLLEAAGAQYRAGLPGLLPEGLEQRVHAALLQDRAAPLGVQKAPLGMQAGTQAGSGRLSRWLVAAAAVALLAFGAAFWGRSAGDAQAMPPEVLTAAALARVTANPSGRLASAPVEQPGTCEEAGVSSPVHFPLVQDGSLRILRCEKTGSGTVARLYRPEDLPTVGYVAVAEPGARTGPIIGMTDLGEVVVYDLAYGSQRHYLAVSRAFLERERALTPGRESCRACHNRSREGQANPHHIVARSWGSGG